MWHQNGKYLGLVDGLETRLSVLGPFLRATASAVVNCTGNSPCGVRNDVV